MFNDRKSVILLSGSEQFLKESTLSRIKSALLDKNSQQFNFNVFYGGFSSAQEVLECANTLPFLGKRRVVLVRRIEDFSETDKKFIVSYVKAPRKSTCLVLETEESNLRQNFFAQLCKYARVVLCKPLAGSQLFNWIENQAQARGKGIKEQARKLLVDNVGGGLQILSKSLDNLTLYIGKRKTITVEDVEKMVGPDLATNAFELFDAVIAGNKKKAFQIVDTLFKDGVNSSQILGALTYQIMSKKSNLDSVQFECGLRELQKADRDIKTGRQSQRIALELLVSSFLDIF